MSAIYDPTFVIISVLVAIFASYTSLDLANSISVAKGRAKVPWIIGGALAMGVGIWSMHFIGMLAYSVPGVSMAYDTFLVFVSVVVAVAASGLALSIVTKPSLSLSSYTIGSLAMAAAIAGMHYIGMAAMLMPGHIIWDWNLVALSLIIALGASFAALWLAFRFRDDTSSMGFLRRGASSIFMGLAISGMHYTGMLAAGYHEHGHHAPPEGHFIIATSGLAGAVTLATIIILAIAIAGSIVDRALTARIAVADEAEASRRKVANILESITNAFYSLNENFEFTYINQRALDHFQKTREELLGKNIWQAFGVADDSSIKHRLVQSFQKEEAVEFEAVSTITGDWVEIHAYPSREGLSVYFQDINDRKVSAAESKAYEERLQLALEIAELGTFDVDIVSGELIINQRGRDIFKWSPDLPLTFAKIESFFYPADKEKVKSVVGKALDPKGSRNFDVQHRILNTSGEVRWIRVRARIFFEETNGRWIPSRALGTYVDITASREAEQQKEASLQEEKKIRREAETSSRLKDEFVATLSHELRTPLNAILGWTQFIIRKNADLSDNAREALIIIERNARSQARLIEDLLDMSRITLGKLQLKFELTDLVDIAERALDAVRPAASAKRVTINLTKVGARMVRGDSSRLQQVIWNLLTNAVKFTPSGGSIDVNLSQSENEIVCSVKDTGMGISERFLPYVFQRFSQADSSSTRKHGGLGIGLALVRQLVELHGGRATVESAGENCGSVFTVTLPVASANEMAPGDSSIATSENPASSLPEAKLLDLEHVRVLVIDDEKDASSFLGASLEEQNATVLVVSSAEEALASVDSFHPDIVVSDIGMPGKDGVDLIHDLRHMGYDHNRLPAIAVTAYARQEDVTRVIAAGFQAHLPKPVDVRGLVALIDQLRVCH